LIEMSGTWKLEETGRTGRSDILFGAVAGEDAASVWAAGSDARLHRIDVSGDVPKEGEAVPETAHTSYITGMARTRTGAVVTGSYDRQLVWWDGRDGKVLRRIPAHGKWIRDVVASPDGSVVASVGDDMVCRLWGAEDGALRGELRGHEALTPHDYPSMLFTAAFSGDGTRLATADKPGRIVIWDVASGKTIRTLDASVMYTWDPTARRHSIGGVRSLAFSPDGAVLAVGGIGQIGNIDHLAAKMRVSLYRAESGEVIKEAEAGEVNGLAERLVFAPDGTWVLAQGGDNKGGWMVLDARTGTVTGEGTSSFHVHEFLPLDGNGLTWVAVGHNGMARQRLVRS